MDRVRWGILGCGAIASSALAPAMRWSSNGTLIAAASREKSKAEALGVPRPYGAYEALLADPEVDAIYIGLPNGLHRRWAIAAAEAGKHVLCDKSLALTADDASAVGEAFRRRGLVLVEGFMVRHHPQWTRAREIVESGAIGAPRHVRAVFRATLGKDDDHRWSPSLGGGALFDVTCYAVNAARYFLREEPTAARGIARWRRPGADASTDAILDFASGAVASVHGSLCAPFEQEVVVSGDRGRLVLARPFVPHWDPTEILVEGESATERFAIPGANHFLHMVEHVAAAVRGGDRGPAEDGVANVRACAMIAAATFSSCPSPSPSGSA